MRLFSIEVVSYFQDTYHLICTVILSPSYIYHNLSCCVVSCRVFVFKTNLSQRMIFHMAVFINNINIRSISYMYHQCVILIYIIFGMCLRRNYFHNVVVIAIMPIIFIVGMLTSDKTFFCFISILLNYESHVYNIFILKKSLIIT